MTRRPYKVNKTWLLWGTSYLSKPSSPSSHPVCSVLLPITLGTTGTRRTSGKTFLFVGVKPDSLWTRWESPAVPMAATTSGGTRVHVCCTLRRWDRARGDERWRAHMSHDSYWYFASSPCYGDGAMHVSPAVLQLSTGVWLSQPSLAGDTCIAPGALGTHTPYFASSCAASALCLGPGSPQSSGCPRPPGRTLA